MEIGSIWGKNVAQIEKKKWKTRNTPKTNKKLQKAGQNGKQSKL